MFERVCHVSLKTYSDAAAYSAANGGRRMVSCSRLQQDIRLQMEGGAWYPAQGYSRIFGCKWRAAHGTLLKVTA